MSSTLSIRAGFASLAGPRDANEDFVGFVVPGAADLRDKGVAAAIADGVSGSAAGREAAEYAVRGLLADYYATPDTWEIPHALERVIVAINRWAQAQSAVRRESMASTLTALVLRGRSWHCAHVGDTRAYLLRGGCMQRLTHDHVWDRPEMQHVLTRGIGLDSRVAVDLGSGELAPGDVFVLATDGIWEPLPQFDLEFFAGKVAGGELEPQAAADQLAAVALAAGSRDNASCLLLRVDAVGAGDLRDSLRAAADRPLPPALAVGDALDDFEVVAVIDTSRKTRVYKVRDRRAGIEQYFVLKTLAPDAADDGFEREALAHEAWITRRAVARFFPQAVAVDPRRQTALYLLTTWHDGATLQQRLDAGAHLAVPDVVRWGQLLARAAGALHRRSIVHRDITPANVHLGRDGELRLLDFGVATSGADDPGARDTAGTPSFVAPELFEGAPASASTDLYAVGVTLYHALTRRYPYGEIEPFQHPRFGQPVAPTRFRPDVPAWLERVLLKAVARDPAQRFETAEELQLALERGAAQPIAAPPPRSLLERNRTGFWRSVAALSLLANLALLLWLARR